MVVQKQNRVVAVPTNQTRLSDKPSNRLAVYKQSAEWKQLPRTVQRDYETNDNRSMAVVHVKTRKGEAVDALRSDSIGCIRNTLGEWQEFLEELADTASDEIREALEIQTKNELASQLKSHQAGLDALDALEAADLEKLLARPDHEWTKRSLEDDIENILTFGEAELERRGHPPLSFVESVLNIPFLGAIADKRLREYERARLRMQPQSADEEEEVIDADWSPK